MRRHYHATHSGSRSAESRGNNRTAVFILAVLAALVLFMGTAALADNGRQVDRGSYAYTRGDYAGIDHAAKSVFYVEIYDADGTAFGTGSGFVMFDEGLFVTNQHVIEGASFLVVEDDDGRQYLLDRVVISDAEHDIAILLFPDAKGKYDSLAYDTVFDRLKRGQAVLAIGSPKGMPGTVSDGIISAFPKFVNEDVRFIQITAPISHGSSGGCLLNDDLKVIGVTTAGIEDGENIGFAIPVSIAEQLYSQWNGRDTVAMGTPNAWDTVGCGIHHRISGATGKPQSPGASSGSTEIAQAGSAGGTEGVQAGSAAVLLDVVWDPAGSKYELTVNGKTVEWGQTMVSAARFCSRNGIRMKHFDNDENKDAFSAPDQPISFGGILDVPDSGFCVRKGANSAELIQIDITVRGQIRDLDELIDTAADAYQKMARKFGNPTRDVTIFTEDGSIDVQTNNFAEAVLQMAQQDGSYSHLSISFDNLHFYVSYNLFDTGRVYEVSFSLVPW